ncbi:MAG: hypothetical protein H7240_11090 [Glaciimonas sp.]|nr:hypothetical protein [Glaciimonas sp.]
MPCWVCRRCGESV